jgi:hypothetical protein
MSHEASPSALAARQRREDLAKERYCINGRPHGVATHGVLCRWCREVHKRGVVAVLADPAMQEYKPPGYRFKPRENARYPEETDAANHSGTALPTASPDRGVDCAAG